MSETNRAGYEGLPFLVPVDLWESSSSVLTELETLPVPCDTKVEIIGAVIDSVRDDTARELVPVLELVQQRLRTSRSQAPGVFMAAETLISRLRADLRDRPGSNPVALLADLLSRQSAGFVDVLLRAYHTLLRPHAPKAVPEPGACGRVDLLLSDGTVLIEADSTRVRVTRGERVLMDVSIRSMDASVAGSAEPPTDADRLRVTNYSRRYRAETAATYRHESEAFFSDARLALAYTTLDDTYTLRVPDQESEMILHASPPPADGALLGTLSISDAHTDAADAVRAELAVVTRSVEAALNRMAVEKDQTVTVGDWVEYSPVLRRIARRAPRREFPIEKMQPGQTMVAVGRITSIEMAPSGPRANVLGPRGAILLDLPPALFRMSGLRPMSCASPGCQRSRSVNLPFCSDHCRSGPTERTVLQVENRALAIRRFVREHAPKIPSEFAAPVQAFLSGELDILTQYVLDGRAAIQREQQAAARREQLALQRAARTAETNAALERQRELETLKALMAKHGVSGTLPGEPQPHSNEPGQRFLDL